MDKLLEEFIKDWRLKNNSKDAIYSSYHYDAMIEFAKHYHSQQLILCAVSHRREQFINLLTSLEKEGGNKFVDKEWIVDNYLKIN
jgi:hypothetical protein